MNALLIDVGNTRVKGRLIDTGSGREVNVPPLPIGHLHRLDEAWRPLAGVLVDVAFISNVASVETEAVLVTSLLAAWPMLRIERVAPAAMTAGVINGYRDPTRLGPDRWMALIGAHALLPNRSLLVCNFGTATTLDLLLHDPLAEATTFVGGVILPGHDVMHAALLARTARLQGRPGTLVDFADNTEDAIISGITLAQRGAVREAWRNARSRVQGPLESVVAGGDSASMLHALRDDAIVHHVPDLVLRGLAVMARLHSMTDTRTATSDHD